MCTGGMGAVLTTDSSCEETVNWAKKICKLGGEDIAKLTSHGVNGKALLQHFESLEDFLNKIKLTQTAIYILKFEISKLQESKVKIVDGFHPEGYHSDNFIADRSVSIKSILQTTQKYGQILLESGPFTGKTWLHQVITEHLRNNPDFKNYNILSLSLLTYQPASERIQSFWFRHTKQNLGEAVGNTFILIDELQVLYPKTIQDVQGAYPYQITQEIMNYILQDNEYFFHTLKKLAQYESIYVICFSSYGSYKTGNLLHTPYDFPFKTSSYSLFSLDEINLLCNNFLKRRKPTSFKLEQFPTKLKKQIWRLTNGHVGFFVCIIHTLNDHLYKFKHETDMIKFLHSNEMLRYLACQRPVPDLEKLTIEQRKTLKKILLRGVIENDEHSDALVRHGWCFWVDGNHNEVSLPCPLLHQLILMNMNFQLRPTVDTFSSLVDFMDKSLELLPMDLLANTLSVSVTDKNIILEELWRDEFYRIGTSLLNKQSIINVQVQVVKKVKVPGKIDFYISGDRDWAIEFLIEGQLPSNYGLNRAQEHVQRLEKGKYAGFQPMDWLVVDFRKPGQYSDWESTSYLKNYWGVIYHHQHLLIRKYDNMGKLVHIKSLPLLKQSP